MSQNEFKAATAHFMIGSQLFALQNMLCKFNTKYGVNNASISTLYAV